MENRKFMHQAVVKSNGHVISNLNMLIVVACFLIEQLLLCFLLFVSTIMTKILNKTHGKDFK